MWNLVLISMNGCTSWKFPHRVEALGFMRLLTSDDGIAAELHGPAGEFEAVTL